MGIFVFSDNQASLKEVFPKTAGFFALSALTGQTPENGDIFYIDVSGSADEDLKKILNKIKNACKDKHWGIIDTKGSVKDSSVLFFEGACDYLGPGILKNSKGLDLKRIKQAMQWQKKTPSVDESESAAEETKESSTVKKSDIPPYYNTSIKLPAASSFPGWKKMQSGKSMPFYLLYCSIRGKTSLDVRLDEKTVSLIHKRFLNYLEDSFIEGEALLWMDSGKDCLFLIPPKIKSIEEVITSCFRILLSAPLVAMETFGISIPVNFALALHYGSINYKPPGKTGTVVSEAINFIFHLGTKKAEPGRLTISDDMPDKSIPLTLQDCFVSAGEFEGRKIWHTKKFSYAKPWF